MAREIAASDRSVIYAIHTPDASGAPMNETAACGSHLGEYIDTGVDLARNADDRPQQLEYTVVHSPAANDTSCNVCRIE